ncbi:ankyrin repeat protein, putative [Trichomonas vaginalis G3]|uniref:Ankyrin repeat protein, putative n=1 Tax=Trichomonas vaginalis (strain ATCC PRA-98 / G3) TaxID=412133 RepID=A2DSL0_TRIV3|nr:protein ubiquitination [Trichomonas vaginalis G3]EAY16590.1 ankyrin repeat protein, putative [Trichomonas vaginalis G3]KAI5532968.1 protein ubiquitination [Trichomonas vaginalis G3]|eukprot:XP_001328813.1 ankyrin repeat protein [Trichomonas vaginalis G3]
MESLIFLNQKDREIRDYTEEIKKLQNELKAFQSQTRNATKETIVTRINENNNYWKAILTKISELKKAGDFESIYNFLDELSEKGDQEMMSKACKEGLWKKIAPKKYRWDNEKNVLHVASEKGNLRLVKSLIECNCDNETKNNVGDTPLIYASRYGKLEVVQYLISIGADKEAKNKFGETPLILASKEGHLEVVKYLISVGADKEVKNNDG